MPLHTVPFTNDRTHHPMHLICGSLCITEFVIKVQCCLWFLYALVASSSILDFTLSCSIGASAWSIMKYWSPCLCYICRLIIDSSGKDSTEFDHNVAPEKGQTKKSLLKTPPWALFWKTNGTQDPMGWLERPIVEVGYTGHVANVAIPRTDYDYQVFEASP